MSTVAVEWQSFSGWLVAGLFTGILSFFSCLLAMRFARRSGMLVPPGVRQSHAVATPTGGGLGLILGLMISISLLQLAVSFPDFWWRNILPGVLLLALIGWLDDRRHVSSILRLLVQLAVSLWLLDSACFQNSIQGLVLCAGLIVGMVWLMNLYNFMDGSDGMAGFQGVFAGLVMAVLLYTAGQHAMALLAVVVAASCAGFLPLNFPSARVFMGDVASVPLGFIFASLAVYGLRTGSLELVFSILVMSVFIVDTTLTLAVRVFHGERWYTAHNQHIYQRLIAYGWSHSRVLMAYQVVNMSLVLPAIVLAKIYPQYATQTALIVLMILGTCWHIINRRLGMHVTGELK